MRSPSGVNAELGELHRAKVVVGFAAAAEALGHRLEGKAAEIRAACGWGKVTKVGRVRPVNGREGARYLGLGELVKGGDGKRRRTEYGTQPLLVIDVRRRPSLDDDLMMTIERMNNV
ncbi:hypothetical protein B0H13DRAFT_1888733 [Mycena leptocephala]|nr:hypothetical protein B0H13DRAFT_1888733 [Mycena leptocephala]